MPGPYRGSCLCGQICFEVDEFVPRTGNCHCTMCQRVSGGPSTVNVTVPIEGFSFTKGKPATYESSPGNLGLFCGMCGSGLAARVAEDPKLILFSLGCLDDSNLIISNTFFLGHAKIVFDSRIAAISHSSSKMKQACHFRIKYFILIH